MNAHITLLDPLISEFATQADADNYDMWFRTKVQEAMNSKKPRIPHYEVLASTRALLEIKRQNRGASQA